MTNRYIYSAAAGAGTGADWANAYTTLAAALTASAAGDDLYVAHDHAETQASAITLTSPGTAANPVTIHCVNRAGSVPPVQADLATTATVSSTGAFSITFAGYAYSYGIAYQAGSAANAATINFASNNSGWVVDSGALRLLTTSSSSSINFGASSITNNYNELRNTSLKFGSVSQPTNLNGGEFTWKGGSVDASGSAPTSLFSGANRVGYTLIEGVDLSFLGSGKTLVVPASLQARFVVKDCKLGASVTKSSSPTGRGPRVEFINCDSGDTNTVNDIYDYLGTETVETTIVRTGGASDGTTPISKKIVTSANTKFNNPYRSKPIVFWNESLSAIAITLQGIWGGGAVPNNDDIWLEVEYPTDASYPTGGYANDGKASNLATNAAQTAGSGTWGGSTTKFSLDVTVTPANKGPIWLTVCCGAASSTFYVDPKPAVV
jgi:hypothetical protein